MPKMVPIDARSWHYTNDVASDFIFCRKGEVHPSLKINVSHVVLPVNYVIEREEHHDLNKQQIEVILGEAFDFFNWVHREFIAPIEVNAFVHRNNTHISQSVGDIVEVEGYGFFMVLGTGWQKIAMWNFIK